MIHGHKPSGYFVKTDHLGRKIEGECRQCVHCQFTWEYNPGSGRRYGFCMKCNGFICARTECIAEQIRLTGNKFDCLPFEEQQKRLMEKIDKTLTLAGGKLGQDWDVTPNGIIVSRYAR